MNAYLNQYAARRSHAARTLTVPAPTRAERDAVYGAALCVPDHGRLRPWRLLELEGSTLADFAGYTSARYQAIEPEAAAEKLDKERQRYRHAPLLVVVIATIQGERIPAVEQRASAACVAFGLLHGFTALGYGAQWLTGWAAYDEEVAGYLQLAVNEEIVALVHVGTPTQHPAQERPQPELAAHLSRFAPSKA